MLATYNVRIRARHEVCFHLASFVASALEDDQRMHFMIGSPVISSLFPTLRLFC